MVKVIAEVIAEVMAEEMAGNEREILPRSIEHTLVHTQAL